MGKSARVLGWEFGRTARGMNALLEQYGYLHGAPGAYGLTEKGRQYAQEQHHTRGTGGYAHYNRSWDTRTWNDETAAALRADMEAGPGDIGEDPACVPLPRHLDAPSDPTESNAVGCDPVVVCGCGGDDDPQPSWAELAALGAVVAALHLAPHVKPFWNNTVKPAGKKLRTRLTKQDQEPSESADS